MEGCRFCPAHSVISSLANVDQTLRAIQVHEINGPLGTLYYEWVLPGNPAAIRRLFTSLKVDGECLSWLIQHPTAVPNRILVELSTGAPSGYYFHQLTGRGHRVRGLFVQAFGHRNVVPCNDCHKMYQRSKSLIDGTKVMRPFFECISIRGFKNDECGNCLFRMGQRCSYRADVHGSDDVKAVLGANDEDSEDGTTYKGGDGEPFFDDKTVRLAPRRWRRDPTDPLSSRGAEVLPSLWDSTSASFKSVHRDQANVVWPSTGESSRAKRKYFADHGLGHALVSSDDGQSKQADQSESTKSPPKATPSRGIFSWFRGF